MPPLVHIKNSCSNLTWCLKIVPVKNIKAMFSKKNIYSNLKIHILFLHHAMFLKNAETLAHRKYNESHFIISGSASCFHSQNHRRKTGCLMDINERREVLPGKAYLLVLIQIRRSPQWPAKCAWHLNQNPFPKRLSGFGILFKIIGRKALCSHAHKCDFPPGSKQIAWMHPPDRLDVLWLLKNHFWEALRVSSHLQKKLGGGYNFFN